MVSMEYVIKTEKLQATKGSSRHDTPPLMHLQFLLRAALLVGLLLSSARWLPVLCSSLEFFFLNLCNAVTGPKFAFVVSNIIVIFLVGESRFSRSVPAAPQPDIYEEFAMRSQSLQGVMAAAEEVLAGEMTREETQEEDEKGSVAEELLVEEEEMEEEEEEEEDEGLAAEELNRKVEDFIAKVNMQRRIEARMLLM